MLSYSLAVDIGGTFTDAVLRGSDGSLIVDKTLTTHHDLLEPVPECQTPLFLAVKVDPDTTVHLFFDAPPEAPTTRGFAGILHAGLDGLTADEVLATPSEFSSQLGLQDLVSPLRLRGMAAMLARIKHQIRERLS